MRFIFEQVFDFLGGTRAHRGNPNSRFARSGVQAQRGANFVLQNEMRLMLARSRLARRTHVEHAAKQTTALPWLGR